MIQLKEGNTSFTHESTFQKSVQRRRKKRKKGKEKKRENQFTNKDKLTIEIAERVGCPSRNTNRLSWAINQGFPYAPANYRVVHLVILKVRQT